MQPSEVRKQPSLVVSNEAGSNAPGMYEVVAFVVADQKRIERIRYGLAAADHQLLSAIRPAT